MTHLTSIFAISALLCSAASAWAGQIELEITGFSNDAGLARIVLMKERSGYEGKEDPERIASVAIRNGRATWHAIGLPEGRFAVIAHHDLNANNSLDRPLFGLPVEPYGYSNGAWTSMGTPNWEDVEFVVGATPTRQSVALRMNAFAVVGRVGLIGVVALALITALLTLWRRKFVNHQEKNQ